MMAGVDGDSTGPAGARDQIRSFADQGVEMIDTDGEVTGRRVMAGAIEALGRTLDPIEAAGVPAGIGSHSLETPIAGAAHGLDPDYCVKTFHLDIYRSAAPAAGSEKRCWYDGRSRDHADYNDKIFCLDPQKTADFVRGVAKPWVAFKVMAAGAIPAQVGVNFAYQHGADFVITGMFDSQLADGVKIAVKALRRARDRERP